jgi:hypothetical protein
MSEGNTMVAQATLPSRTYEASVLLMELEFRARQMHDAINERGGNIRLAVCGTRVGDSRVTVQYDPDSPTHFVYFYEPTDRAFALRALFGAREECVHFMVEKES